MSALDELDRKLDDPDVEKILSASVQRRRRRALRRRVTAFVIIAAACAAVSYAYLGGWYAP